MSRRDGDIRMGWPRPPGWLTAAIVAGTAAIAGGASAQNYPWCSNFADGAGTDCGFSTEEQCRVTVQGSGGYCDRNTQYRPPPASGAPPRHREVKRRALAPPDDGRGANDAM